MFIKTRWNSESYVEESSDPDAFIYETSGDLSNQDEDERLELLGRFRLYYVDVDRSIDAGIPILFVLDTYAQTVEYYDAIFGSNAPGFSDHVMEMLDYDVVGSNLLILDRLEILPRYRGEGLGLSIMRHLIARFSAGAGVVAIKPFPLQHEVEPSGASEREWRANLGLEQLTEDKQHAIEKLSDYYSQLGFRYLDRTPFMVRSTAWPIRPDDADDNE